MKYEKDLIVLVPDKNTYAGINTLLSQRKESLGIRKISYDISIHPKRDPGIYCGSETLLRPLLKTHQYALVFLDREGSGQESISDEEIEKEIKATLEANGWSRRAEVIVFDPELEIWIWAESNHVAKALGWDRFSQLKTWLTKQSLWEKDALKPIKPKEAVESALRGKSIPRSSSIYSEIAQRVSLKKCQDTSFKKFTRVLQTWFKKNMEKTHEVD